jgi:GT2 family glycosyltransferase
MVGSSQGGEPRRNRRFRPKVRNLDPTPRNVSLDVAVTSSGQGKVYIVVLNWNGWHDTVECLESIFRSSYARYQVIVCDNHSDDDSLKQLQDWASGQLTDFPRHRSILPEFDRVPIAKPIRYVTYDRAVAEAGGDSRADGARLVLIQTGENLGFSGGNNVGLRYALARNDLDYAWLLNNDTVVSDSALTKLVDTVEERPDIGICGSTILYYDAPDTVQVRGGISYNRWFATMKPLGEGDLVQTPVDRKQIERKMSYPSGASMLVTREFLRAVGLLNESYFLYYEELDWVRRARGRFRVAYSPGSIVYHKQGRSIRTGPHDHSFDPADFYIHRNRLRYTSSFFPVGLPTAILRTLVAAVARLCRRQPRRAWTIVRLIFSAETYTLPETDRGRPTGRSGALMRSAHEQHDGHSSK